MSPVNEEPEELVPDPRFVRVQTTTRGLMGASDRIPIRLIVLFIILSVCVTLSPTPANIIGVGALFLITIDTALHRR